MERKEKLKVFIIFIVILSLFYGCGKTVDVNLNPANDPLYDLAQLFMLKQEKEIYRRLQDKSDKQEFIREFWTRRDPNPHTSENEFKTEIQRRIAYANTWFWRSKSSKNLGWDTDRGRIFLILGPPDRVLYSSGLGMDRTIWEGQRNRISKHWQHETWYYYSYYLQIYFQKSGVNDYRLRYAGSVLVNAMEDMKLFYVNGNTESLQGELSLNIKLRQDHIILEIPIKSVEFIEKGQQMAANFSVNIKFYIKNKKVHQISRETKYEEKPLKLLERKTVQIAIPIDTELNGKYLLFVEVKDLQSNQTIFEKKSVTF